MSFHGPLRAGLYSALFLFSVILLGLTASRVHHTKSLGSPDTISRGRSGYYEPTTVELLSTSILATLFSLPLMACLCSRSGFGLPHFLAELLGIISLFVLYLVGSALFTNKYRHIGYCRGFFTQCRIVSAIMAFSWMSWAITLFLLMAALAALFHFRKNGPSTREYDARKHHRGAEAAAVGTAGAAAYGVHEHEKDRRNHSTDMSSAGTNHHNGIGSTTAAAGTGAAVGGTTGHHGHHAYDDNRGGTNYGTGSNTGANYASGGGTNTGYNEGYNEGYGGSTGGYKTAPDTRVLENTGPVSTAPHATSAV